MNTFLSILGRCSSPAKRVGRLRGRKGRHAKSESGPSSSRYTHSYIQHHTYIHTYITNSESSQSSVSWEYETLLQRLMDLKNERDELQKNLRSYTYTHIYTYIHTYTYADRISVMDSTELACMT